MFETIPQKINRLTKKTLKKALGFLPFAFLVVLLHPQTTYAIGEGFVLDLATWSAKAMLFITSWLVHAAGVILREVVIMSVVEMGNYVNTPGVVSVWQTFRDIANMAFIFILLYVAIGTILGLGGINIKKMLVRVVIVALLLNFSFFFTKVAVDASNIISIAFYNQIIKTPCGNDGGVVKDIGAAFMCKLGLNSILGTKFIERGNFSEAGRVLTMGVLGFFFFIVAAFVFGAMAVMFIYRFVSLIFLFIFSPLAFASMALPDDKYSSTWTKALTKNCIMAPVFMALVWAILKIATAITSNVNGAQLVDTIGETATDDIGTVLLSYVLIISLMVASLIVAEKLGAAGAGKTLKMLDGSRKWAQGKVGRAFVRGSGIKFLDEKFKDSTFGRSYLGSSIRNITTGAATNYGFGTKRSVQSVDKERKKTQEDFAKDVNKDLEKSLDKQLPKLREKRIADAQKTLTNTSSEYAGMEDHMYLMRVQIAAKERQFADAAERGLAIPAVQLAEHEDNKIRYENLKSYAAELKATYNTAESVIKKTQENIKKDADFGDGKSVATKEEKSTWMPGLQIEKANELRVDTSLKSLKTWKWKDWKGHLTKAPSYITDRNKVSDELRKMARGAATKDPKKALKELSEILGVDEGGGNDPTAPTTTPAGTGP